MMKTEIALLAILLLSACQCSTPANKGASVTVDPGTFDAPTELKIESTQTKEATEAFSSTELALRHIVMGRKNFAGSKTIDGADVAATLYTVIENCKKVGLDPREYLKYVITERWNKRDPKSPLEYSLENFGKNEEVKFPAKSDWEIKPA